MNIRFRFSLRILFVLTLISALALYGLDLAYQKDQPISQFSLIYGKYSIEQEKLYRFSRSVDRILQDYEFEVAYADDYRTSYLREKGNSTVIVNKCCSKQECRLAFKSSVRDSLFRPFQIDEKANHIETELRQIWDYNFSQGQGQ